jgi:hypothetical protein
MNKKQWIAVAETYLGTFLTTSLAVYMAGDRNLKDLGLAGLASVAAPIIRALNPNDKTFGMVGDVVTAQIEAAESPAAKKVKKPTA